ncbi:hypothetical protein MKZ38_008185 [Zalerion maritima]|uniref:Uncharacterized protein n=1 Tax=Zalerion maritima TaxID=339359 RepID=A0AAD5RW30_9PEZI|nr:hypothetical protein MKZ38_008185 [Zalerion maritima]
MPPTASISQPEHQRHPILLSPALPSELLSHILHNHRHPTVLIICGTRQHFLASLAQDVLQQLSLSLHHHHGAAHGGSDTMHIPELNLPAHELLIAPLAQVAVSRHIRLVFVPTVTHLEAWLSVFVPRDTTIPPPPQPAPQQEDPSSGSSVSSSNSNNSSKAQPALMVYGFLSLHRDTSEWSAQGIGNTASALAEAAHRSKFRATVVEPLEFDEEGEVRDLSRLLRETVPILSGAVRREIEHGRWTGRTVDVERVMRRWFRIENGEWEVSRVEAIPLATQPDEDMYEHSQMPEGMEEAVERHESPEWAPLNPSVPMAVDENMSEGSRGLSNPEDIEQEIVQETEDPFR